MFHTLINSTTVPKNRRIIDLNNVPLVSGTSYIKWHLPSSTSAEHRGRTEKSPIKEHKVQWDYEKVIPVRLTIDKNGTLQDFEINFEVLQEYASGSRGERILLGNVKLNLAEYVDASEDNEGGITRRYLMQDSKINSTLKVSISMRQLDGDKTFTAPPLKTAPVFGRIAGIITSETGPELDDSGGVPMMSSKTREIGELQDMYRSTLAASWSSQIGELPADECIENIFAGGDGWAKGGGKYEKKFVEIRDPPSSGKSTEDSMGDEEDSGDAGRMIGHHRRTSSGFGRHSAHKYPGHARLGSKTNGVDNRRHSGGSHGPTGHAEHMHEVNEFNVRDDLRSWEIKSSTLMKQK